jgi:hypothetical protein
MKLKAVTDDFTAYIGMDWADRKHDISLYDRQTQSGSQGTIQSSPETIADWVNHWRGSCPIFLRQTFVAWVDQARRHSDWSQAFDQQQRAAGKSHQKAIRSLAYKWGRILWRCWQDAKPYDEAKYLAALRRKKSPLIAALRKSKAKSKAKVEA